MIRRGTLVRVVGQGNIPYRVTDINKTTGIFRVYNIQTGIPIEVDLNSIERFDKELKNIKSKIMEEKVIEKPVEPVKPSTRLEITRENYYHQSGFKKYSNIGFTAIVYHDNKPVNEFKYQASGNKTFVFYNNKTKQLEISDPSIETFKKELSGNTYISANEKAIDLHYFNGSILKGNPYYNGIIMTNTMSATADCQTNVISYIGHVINNKVYYGVNKNKEFNKIINLEILKTLLIYHGKNQVLFSYPTDNLADIIIDDLFGNNNIIFRNKYQSTRASQMTCCLVKTANIRALIATELEQMRNDGRPVIEKIYT